MSSLLYGRAKRIKVGDRSAKLFLLILCDYADENNRAWPSIDRLMAEGEASASTVQRALRYLEDHGLITRDEDYGTRYPAYENNSRTFASLEERGLIQPDIEGNWSLTDTGHQTALKLLKR